MKKIIILSLVAFILHLIWENAQAPLFQGYASFTQHFPLCFIGAMGDTAITLLIYFIVALLKDDFNWIGALNKKDIAVLAVIGFFIAVGIERNALFFGKWEYASSMPLIPYFEVGLLPILQMSLLLPFSVFVARKLFFVRKNTPSMPKTIHSGKV